MPINVPVQVLLLPSLIILYILLSLFSITLYCSLFFFPPPYFLFVYYPSICNRYKRYCIKEKLSNARACSALPKSLEDTYRILACSFISYKIFRCYSTEPLTHNCRGEYGELVSCMEIKVLKTLFLFQRHKIACSSLKNQFLVQPE